MESGKYIAIDLGGTNASIACFDSVESKKYSDFKKINNAGDFEQDFTNITSAITKMTDMVKGIGMGCPGDLSMEKDMIFDSANLRYWQNKPIKQMLSERFNCPIVLSNDVEAAALGEKHFGNNSEESFLFVIWGTGIGGCYVENYAGKTYTKVSELGHQIIKSDGIKCACGQTGCLEVYAGGGSFIKAYGSRATELSESDWESITNYFALGLVNTMSIRHVPKVIFGGGVANKQPQHLKLIADKFAKFYTGVAQVDFKISELGDNAGVFGALALTQFNA